MVRHGTAWQMEPFGMNMRQATRTEGKNHSAESREKEAMETFIDTTIVDPLGEVAGATRPRKTVLLIRDARFRLPWEPTLPLQPQQLPVRLLITRRRNPQYPTADRAGSSQSHM